MLLFFIVELERRRLLMTGDFHCNFDGILLRISI